MFSTIGNIVSTVGYTIITMQGVQYCEDTFSAVRDTIKHWRMFSIVRDTIKYHGWIPSVLWGLPFSIVEDVQYYGEHRQYCGGYNQYNAGCSVLWGDTFSTVRDTIQHLVGCSILWRDTIKYCVWIPSVLLRIPFSTVFSIVKDVQYCGVPFLWSDPSS